MEQIDCNLLFRWFVGLEMDDRVWDASTFSKNRDRLLEADVAHEFLGTLLVLGKVKRLLSTDHFSVDGTLIEAWASMKIFRPRDGSGDPPGPGRNAVRNFHKEKRSNETHASTTDPDARLFRTANGQESKLAYLGHALMENRDGLIVDAPFVTDLKARHITPHIAINGPVSKLGKVRKTAVDRRTTRHPGYVISLAVRKRIEEAFGSRARLRRQETSHGAVHPNRRHEPNPDQDRHGQPCL